MYKVYTHILPVPNAIQLTLEKSDSLGTKSRRKRLRDYLGGRGTKSAAWFSFYSKEISMEGDLC